MKKIMLAFSVAVMLTVLGSVSATLPEINDNNDMNTTVGNTQPYIIYGWVDILDQVNVLKYTSFDAGDLNARIAQVESEMTTDLGFTVDLDLGGLAACIEATYPVDLDRCAPYCFESESVWVYVIFADLSGPSDFWQHEMKAYWSPLGQELSEMALTEDFSACSPHNQAINWPFMNDEATVAIAKGEQFIGNAVAMQCMHDIFIEDYDKYGATSIPAEYTVIDPIYVNPYFGAEFTPPEVTFIDVISCGPEVQSRDQHCLHVGSYCEDDTGQPVNVPVQYTLSIHGTDMEGTIGSDTMHVIPAENVRYEWEHESGTPSGADSLTCGEVLIGEFVTCECILFDFFLTPPCPIEPGDYHGEVGFGIAAV
jgi:hypothetical protein